MIYTEIVTTDKTEIITPIEYIVFTVYIAYVNGILVSITNKSGFVGIDGSFVKGDVVCVFEETTENNQNFQDAQAMLMSYIYYSQGDSTEKDEDYSNNEQEFYNDIENSFYLGNLLPDNVASFNLTNTTFTKDVLLKMCVDNYDKEKNTGPHFIASKISNFYQCNNSAFTKQFDFNDLKLHVNYMNETEIQGIFKSLKLISWGASTDDKIDEFEYYERVINKTKTLSSSTTWNITTDYGNYPLRKAGAPVKLNGSELTVTHSKEFVNLLGTFIGSQSSIVYENNNVTVLEKINDFEQVSGITKFYLDGNYLNKGEELNLPSEISPLLSESEFKYRALKLDFQYEYPFAEGIFFNQGRSQNTIFNLLYVKAGVSYLRVFHYPTAQSHTDTEFSAELTSYLYDSTPTNTSFTITKTGNAFSKTGKCWFSKGTEDLSIQIFPNDSGITLSDDMILERFEEIIELTDQQVIDNFRVTPTTTASVFLFSTQALKTEQGNFGFNVIPKRKGVQDSLKSDFFTEISYVSGFATLVGDISRFIFLTSRETEGVMKIEKVTEGVKFFVNENLSHYKNLNTVELYEGGSKLGNFYGDRQQIEKQSDGSFLVKQTVSSDSTLRFKLGFLV